MILELKYIFVSFLILLSGMMRAQQPDSQECLVLDVDYSMDVSESAKVNGSATVTVQGNAYRMSGNGIEAYCDGTLIWMLDNEAKEVYIEPAETASESYMRNPAKAIKDLNIKEEGVYLLDDGRKIHITVRSMKKTDGKDIASFRPTQNFDSSWIVTDLR